MFLRNHIECMFRDIHKVLTHDNKLKTSKYLTYPIISKVKKATKQSAVVLLKNIIHDYWT